MADTAAPAQSGVRAVSVHQGGGYVTPHESASAHRRPHVERDCILYEQDGVFINDRSDVRHAHDGLPAQALIDIKRNMNCKHVMKAQPHRPPTAYNHAAPPQQPIPTPKPSPAPPTAHIHAPPSPPHPPVAHLYRKTMRPLLRSYGEISTRTVSPTRIRM